jgi:hypothetical protein
LQYGAVLTSSASCWPSSASCAATTPVALCNLQRALIIFNNEGGELRCAVLLAVRCGAHLISKLLAVERLGRYNDVVGATCILQGLILYCFKQRGGNAAHCAAPTLARAVERFVRCNNDVGPTCSLQGTLNNYMEGGSQCCAACSACAALTSTASRWLNSALRVAATRLAVTRKLRGALLY